MSGHNQSVERLVVHPPSKRPGRGTIPVSGEPIAHSSTLRRARRDTPQQYHQRPGWRAALVQPEKQGLDEALT